MEELLTVLLFVCVTCILLLFLFAFGVFLWSIFTKRWNHLKCVLLWTFFPVLFPYVAKKHEVIKKSWKSWLLVFVSPPVWAVCLIALFMIAIDGAMGRVDRGVPTSIHYHTKEDLQRVTGVRFPEVTPVDSMFETGWNLNCTRIKMVPKHILTTADFVQLEKACREDSCCWRRDSVGYHYYICPEYPIDRTKGTHWRKIELKKQDGTTEMVDDMEGDYLSVFVPLTGDTITVEDGWIR